MKRWIVMIFAIFAIFACNTYQPYGSGSQEISGFQRRFRVGDEAISEKVWLESVPEYVDPAIVENEKLVYYLLRSEKKDDFAERLVKTTEMMILQKNNAISRDIHSINIAFIEMQTKDKPTIRLLHFLIHSKEWFFLKDYADVKIGDEIIRLDGNSDSDMMGKSPGFLITTLLTAVTDSLFSAVQTNAADTTITARLYTDKGSIDIDIPHLFVDYCRKTLQ